MSSIGSDLDLGGSMNGKSGVALGIAVCLVASGCASSSREIAPAYVSPMQYEGYSCEQLVSENSRIQSRISAAAGNVDDRASGDRVKMGVGLVLFWPTLFFLKGDGAEAQELARLRGEHEAIENVYIRKGCANRPAPVVSEAGSESSLRLTVNGQEVVGRPCEVIIGGASVPVRSGGLFTPRGVGDMTVRCTLTDGDRVTAVVRRDESGRFPAGVVVAVD